MSLPESQLRTLETIEQRLREPRLTAMFAIFTRLAEGEMLPRRETIDPRDWSFHSWFSRPAAGGSRGRRRRWHEQVATIAAVTIVPFMVIVAISTVIALVVKH